MRIKPLVPRAAIVVTGSELVRGDRNDRNGPFLAAALVGLGLEPERVTVVGDRPELLEAALAEGLGADLLLVSGGLGPTHDDRTIELLAAAAGRALVVDEALERQIEEISRAIAERIGRPFEEFAAGVTKQATLPEGGRRVRARGDGARGRARHGHDGRRRAAGAAPRAAAPLAAGARDRGGAARCSPR